MKYDALIKKLEAKASGGHPDGARQDGLAREAADAIVLLQSELTATRNALEEERERCAKEMDRREQENANTPATKAVYRNAARAIRALPSPQVKG